MFNTIDAAVIESLHVDYDPETPISNSVDILFNLADAAGVRETAELNYEFNRNITVNMS